MFELHTFERRRRPVLVLDQDGIDALVAFFTAGFGNWSVR